MVTSLTDCHDGAVQSLPATVGGARVDWPGLVTCPALVAREAGKWYPAYLSRGSWAILMSGECPTHRKGFQMLGGQEESQMSSKLPYGDVGENQIIYSM